MDLIQNFQCNVSPIQCTCCELCNSMHNAMHTMPQDFKTGQPKIEIKKGKKTTLPLSSPLPTIQDSSFPAFVTTTGHNIWSACFHIGLTYLLHRYPTLPLRSTLVSQQGKLGGELLTCPKLQREFYSSAGICNLGSHNFQALHHIGSELNDNQWFWFSR